MVCHSRPMVYAYVPNFSSIGLFSRPLAAKNAIFWTLAFSGVANWQQSEILEHGCTTTNLPVSNSIKIVSVLLGKIVRTNCTFTAMTKRQTDRQTDRQKTQRFWLPHTGRLKSEPHQTWHADEDL